MSSLFLRGCRRFFPSQVRKLINPSVCSMQKMSSLTSSFDEAKQRLSTLQNDPGNDAKLKLYALFKQSTVGACNTKKPSVMDFVGKAKWDAWTSLGSMSTDAAMKEYVALVNGLAKDEPVASGKGNVDQKYEGLTFVVSNNITKITFNRPTKKNAITTQMYRDISDALKEAANNETSAAVITGEGDYYSSGNDLNNFTTAQGDVSSAAKSAGELLKGFVASFIDFPKPLIAAVNGPAVGIPVTLLGLFDAVYASDKASFTTPFSLLGQTPEGCATYTFPKIMGYSKANEILLFNKKLTAAEAKEMGLVTAVFPHNAFHKEVEDRLNAISKASKNSLLYSKELIRGPERSMLHKVNASECERLVERWQSPDCMEAIMNFFQRKGKL